MGSEIFLGYGGVWRCKHTQTFSFQFESNKSIQGVAFRARPSSLKSFVCSRLEQRRVRVQNTNPATRQQAGLVWLCFTSDTSLINTPCTVAELRTVISDTPLHACASLSLSPYFHVRLFSLPVTSQKQFFFFTLFKTHKTCARRNAYGHAHTPPSHLAMPHPAMPQHSSGSPPTIIIMCLV